MGTLFHQDATTQLIHGNALELSQFIKPESVDLIITSPPYFALRSYKDGDEHYAGQIGDESTPQQFLEALWKVTAECQKVLKPGGNLFVNLGDKYQNKSLMGLPWRYATGCVDGAAGQPWILRAEIVWDKPNGLPEPTTDRVRRSHETWFHFTRNQKHFACINEIREPHKHQDSPTARRGPSGTNRSTNTGRTHDDGTSVGNFNHNELGRVPGSVWTIPLEPLRVPDWLGIEHFAAFPQEWPRRIIQGWTPEGGTVLDPFCGTGTVPMVARALGRNSIGVDLSNDYLRLAKWRVWESGHAAKTIERTNLEAQTQMFGDL